MVLGDGDVSSNLLGRIVASRTTAASGEPSIGEFGSVDQRYEGNQASGSHRPDHAQSGERPVRHLSFGGVSDQSPGTRKDFDR
jgi:hypothetical protein